VIEETAKISWLNEQESRNSGKSITINVCIYTIILST